jgi:hypothetical protein
MRMLNRAIEDAADFGAFRDALMARNPTAPEPARRDGEGRTARRARDRAERKAATKTLPKVKA